MLCGDLGSFLDEERQETCESFSFVHVGSVGLVPVLTDRIIDVQPDPFYVVSGLPNVCIVHSTVYN